MGDETYPDDLRYHPEHDWARVTGDEATFGITWYAQDKLGELVFVDLEQIGGEVTANEPYTLVDSAKASSDVFAPLSGEVIAVNESLENVPETINDDPYGEGWILKVRLRNPDEANSLLDVEAYKTLLQGAE